MIASAIAKLGFSGATARALTIALVVFTSSVLAVALNGSPYLAPITVLAATLAAIIDPNPAHVADPVPNGA